MTIHVSGCFSLLVLILSTLSPSTSANSSKGTPAPTASNCHNVIYNSFSAGPNKEVKNLLQEMKMQLADLEAKIRGITRNKTTDKGENKPCCKLRAFEIFFDGDKQVKIGAEVYRTLRENNM